MIINLQISENQLSIYHGKVHLNLDFFILRSKY